MRFSRHFSHASTVLLRIDLGSPLPARLEAAGSWIFWALWDWLMIAAHGLVEAWKSVGFPG